jgi:para-nitrobenzyl esterase
MSKLQAIVVWAVIACAAAAAWAHPQGAPVVKTRNGDVQGVVGHQVFVFKGIPYAAPPVGDLRWREPHPPASWQGVRQASTFGNACIQTPGLSAANGGDAGPLSEDCLYLNVWTPNLAPSTKLPVMVWIHGGAYIFGAGSLAIYDGASLANRGAVFVSLNYRLAQLGFFAHPALEQESPGGPVNFGLLDQIAALEWVQQNIAQFGGDPNNVTILGQSAGAKSVLALFASPLARGLFRKGVAMSSYALPEASRAKALDIGVKVADGVGLKGANATAAELRAVPAAKFGELEGQGISLGPVPAVGDKVLPQSIQDTFATRKEVPGSLILGNVSDDSSVVVAFGVDPAQIIRGLRGAGVFAKALYPGVKDEAQLGRLVARDLIFTSPVRALADSHSKLAPTYRYYFDYTSVKARPRFPHGVGHGAEIVYFLDTGDLSPDTQGNFSQPGRDYARHASDYLLEFARSGRPASAGSSPWPNHDARNDRTLQFSHTVSVQPNFMKARLNVFIRGSKLLAPILNRK